MAASMPSSEFDAISALIDGGRFDEAIARARPHARDGVGEAQALVARALLEAQRFDECRAMLPQAIEAAPSLDWLHRFAFMLHRREGRSSEALASIHRAQRLAPEIALNYEFEAHALIDLGRLHDAIAALEDGIAVDVMGEARARLEGQLGRCYAKLGRFIDAEQHLRRAIDAGRTPPAWHYEMLAEVLEARGQEANAFVARALASRGRATSTELPGTTRGAVLVALSTAVLCTVIAVVARLKGAVAFALVMLGIGFVAALLTWARTLALQPSLDEVDEQLLRWWSGGQRA